MKFILAHIDKAIAAGSALALTLGVMATAIVPAETAATYSQVLA